MKPFFILLPAFLSLVQVRAESPAPAAPLLQPFVDRHELAGAVALVADKNRILSLETVGFADIAEGEPMAPDTMFWIASQSKAMTAVALLMLVDEGKAALDDPVEKFLSEFRNQMVITESDDEHCLLSKPAHPITIREILSHMSGLPFSSAIETPTLDGLPLATTVRSYAMTPLRSEPGTRYQYSNAGINTAARIVEVLGGKPYEDFMRERLFEPLGMSDTTFWPNEEQIGRIAHSYRPGPGGTGLEAVNIDQLTYPLNDRTRRFPMPGGGLFSTAGDVSTYCRMLLNRGELDGRRYISEASFKELTRRQTPDSVPDSYGFGLAVGADWFGHGGAFATNMEVRPDMGLVLVWMVQHGGFPGEGGKAQNVFREHMLKSHAR